MSRYLDLTNRRFARLIVVKLDRLSGIGKRRRAYWNCRCDCGNEKSIRTDGLTSGVIQSCGCLGIERRTAASALITVTHGMTRGKRGSNCRPAEYRAWSAMKNRCRNPNTARYEDWGGRGITVCDRWRDSFVNFYADLGPRPGPGYSIDRIKNDGNYEPGNCRWADPKTQRANRRDSAQVE